jgi:hypothetical protein
MADYFTRLAEQTLGLFPTVRPDIPPTFAMETAELAPYDAPHGDPPPGPVTRHTGPSPQRPALYPEPPEQAEEATPPAGDGDQWPDTGERGYDPSTAAGTPDLTGAPLVSSDESFPTQSTEETAQIEHPPAGPGRADDEPPRGLEHQRRSNPTSSGAAVPGAMGPEDPSAEGPSAEAPSIFPDLHEAPPSRPGESTSGSSESRIERAGHPSVPPGPGAHPAEHPGVDDGEIYPGPAQDKVGAEQGESDVSQSRRRARSLSVRTDVPPPTDATIPDRRADPDRARPSVPERSRTRAARQEGRDLVVGREEHDREAEPLAASGRAERPGTDHLGTDHGESDMERGEIRTSLDDTGASARRRGAGPSSEREHQAPPAGSAVPDRRTRSIQTSPPAQGHSASQAAGHAEQARAIEREQRERTPEPSGPAADATDTVDARGRPLAQAAAASDRGGRPYEPSDRPVHGTPLVPAADSPRARPAARRVVAPHEREVAKEASTSTVRITIGRVEVRAVVPEPAQPPPVARPEPVLSLYDYLKQHDGGRR